MKSISSNRLALVLLLAAGLAACDKAATPPTGFGVNVTVDAKALTTAHVAAARNGSLLVVVNGVAAAPKELKDIQAAIKSGELRFHYTPDPAVVAKDKLMMSFDVLSADGTVLASGATKTAVTLTATAVAVTIKLEDLADPDGGTPDGSTEGGAGKANGTPCATGTQCGSGFCADGVCCNEKCDDICVSCNQAATKGTCTPFAVNTDPEMECIAKLPPASEPEDGGAPATDAATADAPAGDGPAASDAATAPLADAAPSEAAASDAAVINAPDGGLMSMPNACAGTCGARACKYPDKTKSCGKAFCNTKKDVAAFFCDGMGACNLQLSECTGYACDDATGACKAQCGAHEDCLTGKYCNGTNNMCAPKKGNSLTCVNGGECASGNCIGGVCCNTACTGAGLSCATGQCACPGVTCAAGVACQVFYQDLDADTFGNRNGSIAAATAKAGCAGSAPPVGFVADNTDCDDTDANAKPGQTAFFGVQRKGGGYDFDCDDKTTKETPEYPGLSCKFCGAVGTCDATTTTCTAAGQTASFVCPQEIPVLKQLGEPLSMSLDFGRPTLGELGTPGLLAALPPGGGEIVPIEPPIVRPPICKVCTLQCCGCHAADKTGFRQVVACGDASIAAYTCGSCAAVGGAASVMTPSARQQKCR